MAKVIKARGKLQEGFAVFLSGSVAGDDWRGSLIKRLQDKDLILLDPRSDDYSSLKRTSLDPYFCEQVEWELDGLEKANVIALYFNASSASPISLLEFGLFAQSGRLIVFCPEGFKHKAYVDIISGRFDVEQVNTMDELAGSILSRYSKWNEKE